MKTPKAQNSVSSKSSQSHSECQTLLTIIINKTQIPQFVDWVNSKTFFYTFVVGKSMSMCNYKPSIGIQLFYPSVEELVSKTL